MLRYDEHADFQIARRAIDKTWIEATLRDPDATEVRNRRRSFLKCLPGRHVMLRVVMPVDDPQFVITACFDRKKPCA